MDHGSHGDYVEGAFVSGTNGDDVMHTAPGASDIRGLNGNDTLHAGNHGGALFGGNGDDVLYGGGDGKAQAHMYGGRGNDTFYLSTADRSAPHGEHVWGEQGNDKFIFTNVEGSTERIVGRIDDFDSSRDEIWIDDQKIDLFNPPPNVRIVQYQDQPWILINDRILYALEGARFVPEGSVPGRDDEVHFIDWPAEWADGVPASADIDYTDNVAQFPAHMLAVPEGSFNRVNGSWDRDEMVGTAGNDWLWGADKSDLIRGNDGNDLIDGREGHDVIFGGAGNDSISGGLDRDLISGGEGNDVIFGGSENDTLFGDQGNDRLYGNSGDDFINGGSGDDQAMGGQGDDTVIGGDGSDLILGEDGDDLLIAGRTSHEGHDVLPAAPDIDILHGGNGNDTLFGADDQLTYMSGGDGEDVFHGAGAGKVIIQDFTLGEDRLDLSGLIEEGKSLEEVIRSVGDEDDPSNSFLEIQLADGGTVELHGHANLSHEELRESLILNEEVAAPELQQEDHFPSAIDPVAYVDGDGWGAHLTIADVPPENWHEPDVPDTEEPDGGDGGGHGGHGGDGDSDEEDEGGGDADDGDGDGGDDVGNPPDQDEEEESGGSDGSCFVATASYGDGHHPDVACLRNWRDTVLVTHPLGRAFIAFYWRVGPKLARFVDADRPSGSIGRRLISPIVSGIRAYRG